MKFEEIGVSLLVGISLYSATKKALHYLPNYLICCPFKDESKILLRKGGDNS